MDFPPAGADPSGGNGDGGDSGSNGSGSHGLVEAIRAALLARTASAPRPEGESIPCVCCVWHERGRGSVSKKALKCVEAGVGFQAAARKERALLSLP